MLDEKGFDLWADGYDRSVGLCDEDGSYPFAGYREVLNRVCRRVLTADRPRVLELGFGTGALTAKLCERGCDVWGQDFSARMRTLARRRAPGAHLFQGDFSSALAGPLLQNTYDFIVATYALHHLMPDAQVSLLRNLFALLKEDGEILIGDVAFKDAAALERCRADAGGEWDDEEYYFVFEDFRRAFPDARFDPVSHCAGIITLGRPITAL